MSMTCVCGGAKKHEWNVLCARCWYRLPQPLRDRVWKLYRTAQGSPAHVAAVRECIQQTREAIAGGEILRNSGKGGTS